MKQLLLILLLTPTLLFSGNAKDKIEKPTTKIEKAKRVKGSIMIKGYERVGKYLNGKYGHTLEVTIYEFKNIKTKSKIYGLSIEIDTGAEYNNRASSFIDYDEINSLIKGIEYIQSITKNPTKLKNYEATYKTKGGVLITNFNSREGDLSVIQVGRYSTKSLYLKTDKLEEFKTILLEAKEKIKSIK